MFNYVIRRLILLPITLFFIVLVNFVIVNLAPGDPVTVTEISPEGGAMRRQDRSIAFGRDEIYLQFREFYGLTLPVLFNNWPWLSSSYVNKTLWQIVNRRVSPDAPEMEFKTYDDLRILFGDQSRFVMPYLLEIIQNPKNDFAIRQMAVRFFSRGGSHQAYVGPTLTAKQKEANKKFSQDNIELASFLLTASDTPEQISEKVNGLSKWYAANAQAYHFAPTPSQKLTMFFFETRFFKYMSRVLELNFGSLRNDPNKTVISEVTKRFKYSLTLALLPMIFTFFACLFFGMVMALYQDRFPDLSLNVFFLILYAIPVFVVAPFLIENIALNHNFPFTDTPIPISGFTSSDTVYDQETSAQRIADVIRHIFLPLVAIVYGTMAVQSRLSRTAILEVLRQDYVRTAKAKGLPFIDILVKHVGRNASITLVTSIAGSLGIVLGGSLIVETLFEINGFGKFFYDAILNRDFNVIMFSALAGSFLTLLGYLTADIAYTVLDPRVTLE